MARIKMITRTVDIIHARVMVVDVSTAKVDTVSMTISGKFTDNAELLKAVQNLYDTDTLKHVNISSASADEILYGMPEDVFIRHAKILPPRTSKDTVE